MDSITDLKTALAAGKITSEQYVQQLEAIAVAKYEADSPDRQRRQRIEEAKTLNWRALSDQEQDRRESQLRRDLRIENARQSERPRPRVIIDAATLNDEQFASLERAMRGIATANDYHALEAAGAVIKEL